MGDEHVLGHAAVEAEAAAEGADLRLVLAVVLGREPAGAAAPAAPRAVDGHRLALLEALDAGAERLDPARVLVAEGEGEVEVHRPLRPLHQVQVRVACPGATDLDQDLPRPRLGNRDLTHLGRRLPGGQLVGLHLVPPSECGSLQDEAKLRGGDQAACAIDRVDVDGYRIDAAADEELGVLGMDRGGLAADRCAEAELAGAAYEQFDVLGHGGVALVEDLGHQLGVAIGAEDELGQVVGADRDSGDAELRVAR